MAKSEARKEFLQDVIDIASSGIAYWAVGNGVYGDDESFGIIDFEELQGSDDDPFENGSMWWNHAMMQRDYVNAYNMGLIPETYVYTINQKVVSKGIKTLLELELVNDEMLNRIRKANKKNDADIDADDADAIIQAGLWGEVKYG